MVSWKKTENRPAQTNKIMTSLGVAFLIVSNLFVFGPVTLYQGNTDELTVPLTSILSTLALPALIIFLALGLIGLLLRGKSHQLYISILFAFGLLAWLQGNFILWKYGLLDGQGIDWTKNAWRGWADGALWTGLLVLSVIFYRKVYRIAAWGSAAVTAVLIVSLLITSLQKPETWAAKEKSSQPLVPPEEIFEFSSQFNVIHVILDGYQSDIFSELVARDHDHYSKSLQGFTFFKEALGSFRSTYMSVPAFISGQVYKNEIPMGRFVKAVNRGKTVFNALYDRGYETHLVGFLRFIQGARYSQGYQIAVPYGGTARQNVRTNSALMLDLVLFRHAPHFLKRYIYNDQTWLIQRIVTPKNNSLNFNYFSHAAFLDDLIEHLSVKRDKPVYKYIHLMTSHPPMVVNKDCKYAGKIRDTWENNKIQAKCSLDHIIKFLDKLRSKGLYDSSLIILQSDHGRGHKIAWVNAESPGDGVNFVGGKDLRVIAGSALALLLIKPPQDKGRFRISEAQVSLTEIPATISSILPLDEKFVGRSVFEVDPDEKPERRYLYHAWGRTDWQKTYFSRLDEFVVKGSVFDRNSWRLDCTHFPPGHTK
jgi:hypothetical protein